MGMRLFSSTVGRKNLMALSGQALIAFVVMHLLGNFTVYSGALNSYAERLHSLPLLVWSFRLIMLAALTLHVFYGAIITLENRAAKPQAYAVTKTQKATFASKNMIWTGSAIAAFLLYHLIQFTFSGVPGRDLFSRPDVFGMVVQGFSSLPVVLVYVASITALFYHLSHGIQSSFQTLGLNSEAAMPFIMKSAVIISLVLFGGYSSIPLFILLGAVR